MGKIIWQQQFTNGATDFSDWNFRIGNDLLDNEGNAIHPGWGNGELQFYTDKRSNAYIDEHGLHICARRETTQQGDRTFAYTSARLDTRDRFSFCYGKLTVRAKLPVGQGLWPAIWLMPQEQVYGPWPASGEIDILEAKGRLPQRIFGTLHYGKDWENKRIDEFSYMFEQGSINSFHDYGLEWTERSIRWLIDGHCYAEKQLDPLTMPFNEAFYLVVNLAVGGWFDNVEVEEGALPATMTISHIVVEEV